MKAGPVLAASGKETVDWVQVGDHLVQRDGE